MTQPPALANDPNVRTDDRMSALINQLVAFVAVLDPDGRLKEVDQAALAVAGLREEDVIGRHFWDTFWWDYDPEVQGAVRDDIEGAREGRVTRRETAAQTADGGRLWVRFHVGPIYDAAGKVVEIVASGSDISTQKEHEAALEKEREQLELLNRELRHRVRNLFAIVQAGLSISARTTDTKEEMIVDARSRISSLAASHMAGVEKRPPEHFTLDELAHAVLAPHDPGDDLLRIEGPALDLPEHVMTPITLILHELATNAVRHGTWSAADGRVSVEWRTVAASDGGSARAIELCWEETAPDSERLDSAEIKRLSFSKGLVERCASQLGGAVRWVDRPEGWQASVSMIV
ncbi:PAS domain S-box protein [Sphingomicrobium sp. XHP0239]|uniref:PAS domain S-box protein n=1 Tax=Sphingomicrobium maritimum TaxID=3133972 RepID=UPI0031CCC203